MLFAHTGNCSPVVIPVVMMNLSHCDYTRISCSHRTCALTASGPVRVDGHHGGLRESFENSHEKCTEMQHLTGGVVSAAHLQGLKLLRKLLHSVL